MERIDKNVRLQWIKDLAANSFKENVTWSYRNMWKNKNDIEKNINSGWCNSIQKKFKKIKHNTKLKDIRVIDASGVIFVCQTKIKVLQNYN